MLVVLLGLSLLPVGVLATLTSMMHVSLLVVWAVLYLCGAALTALAMVALAVAYHRFEPGEGSSPFCCSEGDHSQVIHCVRVCKHSGDIVQAVREPSLRPSPGIIRARLGTFSAADQSWLWAWANEAFLPQARR